MSDVLRKRLLLAMTVSALALAVVSWGSMAPAQEAADPAEGGESAVGEEGIDSGELPDDAALGDPAEGGEITIDDGWVGGGEITIDDGWADEGVITIDDGWVDEGSVIEENIDIPPSDEGSIEDPAVSEPYEGIPEDPGLFDPESVAGAPEVTTFDEAVMMQSGLPEVQRDLAPGTPSAAAGGALPVAREGNGAGEGCRTAGKEEVCVAP